jgi:GntR family transcriptional regulator, transcriptional repressor for pyruvate dehydrogenase complex
MFSRPPGLAQYLASEIEELIGTRGLHSGDRIATMEELREQTGYGRATIGETARLLSERGSVEVRPGRGGGLFVAQVSPVVRLRQTLLTVPQGATTVADAIAVRDRLEELIAVEAAANRTDQDIRELESCLDEVRRAGDDLEHFLRANWSLHERIAAIAPNHLARAMYVGMMRCIAELSVGAEPGTAAAPGDYLAQRLAVHEDLVAAIRLGDEKLARAAIAAHRGDAAPAATGGPTEIDESAEPGAAGGDGERLAALERENRELRRTNAILKSASAFFAAELDRPVEDR